MFGGSGGLSLADIAAACNNNDGNGMNNGWWVIIILLALWGRNGFGNGDNNGNGNNYPAYLPFSSFGFSDAAMQRGFDNQTVITKLDGLNSGICGLGYDQLAQMNGINQNIMQTGFTLQQTANQGQVANMQAFNALAAQLSQCCCDQRAQIADLKYDMATSDCSIKTLINQATQQIMWGQQSGFRDLMDLINNKFCQLEMSQKDNVIAELRAQLATCGNNSALQNLYQQLIATLHPNAVPAYPAANPNGMGNWSSSVLAGQGWNCGCNSCCG